MTVMTISTRTGRPRTAETVNRFNRSHLLLILFAASCGHPVNRRRQRLFKLPSRDSARVDPGRWPVRAMEEAIDGGPEMFDRRRGRCRLLPPCCPGEEIFGGHLCQLFTGHSDRRKQIIKVGFRAGGRMILGHGALSLNGVFALHCADVVSSGGCDINRQPMGSPMTQLVSDVEVNHGGQHPRTNGK